MQSSLMPRNATLASPRAKTLCAAALALAFASPLAAQAGYAKQVKPDVQEAELRTIELVHIPEPGQSQPQETLVYDYDVDAADMILAGYKSVSPDLPIRAMRDANGDIQLIMANGGMFLFYGAQLNGGNFRMIGPDFDSLSACLGTSCTESCSGEDCFTLRSDADPATCNFNDTIWIGSVWREGNTIHALVHNEYEAHGHDFGDFPTGQPLECEHCEATEPNCCNRVYRTKGINISTPAGYVQAIGWCQTTNLTYAESIDGGATFQQRDDWEQNGVPDFVAHGPYEFISDPQDHLCLSDPMDPDSPKTTCPQSLAPYGGYTHPSNIVKHPTDGYWYVLVRQWLPPKFLDDNPGPENLWAEVDNTIVMRTDDLSDPSSWRAWGGQFNQFEEPIYDVVLIDPYREANIGNPIDHVGYPINPFWQYSAIPGVEDTVANFAASLTWNTYLEKWVLVDSAPYVHYENGNPEGRRGVFFAVSDDLINWSKRQLTDPPIWTDVEDRPMYPSLIDHDSPSVNFHTSGKNAYIYVQREETNGSAWADVIRQRVSFEIGLPKPIE